MKGKTWVQYLNFILFLRENRLFVTVLVASIFVRKKCSPFDVRLDPIDIGRNSRVDARNVLFAAFL